MTSLALATFSIIMMLMAIALVLANIVAQLKVLNAIFTEILKDIKARNNERQSS